MTDEQKVPHTKTESLETRVAQLERDVAELRRLVAHAQDRINAEGMAAALSNAPGR